METKQPNETVQGWIGLGLMAVGLWVVWPLLDLLRVGFGSPLASKYFFEAFGRAIVALFGLAAIAKALRTRWAGNRHGLSSPGFDAIAWARGKITGTTPPASITGRP